MRLPSCIINCFNGGQEDVQRLQLAGRSTAEKTLRGIHTRSPAPFQKAAECKIGDAIARCQEDDTVSRTTVSPESEHEQGLNEAVALGRSSEDVNAKLLIGVVIAAGSCPTAALTTRGMQTDEGLTFADANSQEQQSQMHQAGSSEQEQQTPAYTMVPPRTHLTPSQIQQLITMTDVNSTAPSVQHHGDMSSPCDTAPGRPHHGDLSSQHCDNTLARGSAALLDFQMSLSSHDSDHQDLQDLIPPWKQAIDAAELDQLLSGKASTLALGQPQLGNCTLPTCADCLALPTITQCGRACSQPAPQPCQGTATGAATASCTLPRLSSSAAHNCDEPYHPCGPTLMMSTHAEIGPSYREQQLPPLLATCACRSGTTSGSPHAEPGSPTTLQHLVKRSCVPGPPCLASTFAISRNSTPCISRSRSRSSHSSGLAAATTLLQFAAAGAPEYILGGRCSSSPAQNRWARLLSSSSSKAASDALAATAAAAAISADASLANNTISAPMPLLQGVLEDSVAVSSYAVQSLCDMSQQRSSVPLPAKPAARRGSAPVLLRDSRLARLMHTADKRYASGPVKAQS